MAETDNLGISIKSELTLPSGLTLPNRLVKAAMTEGLADSENGVTDRLIRLYERWGHGGIGLQITGNVQVDPTHLEKAGNVVIFGPQSNQRMTGLADWAKASKAGGAPVLMQLSHAGRQTPSVVNEQPAAPSAVALALPGKFFATPREMTGEEVADVISGFGFAAKIARETGFDGVQVHAAHGYLISQFLNPLANHRTDAWGGALENRARLLREVVSAVRSETARDFTISVKLNSADFQKGGFSHEDCLAVVDMLNELGVDLLEVSGGSYEQPKMIGNEGLKPAHQEPVRASTLAREAYFLDYAESVKAHAQMPVMVTGGLRTRAAMDEALGSGAADAVGLGRPLCVDPNVPRDLLSGDIDAAPAWERDLRLGPTGMLGPNSPIGLVKLLNNFGAQGWFYQQILRLADGEAANTRLGVFSAFRRDQSEANRVTKAWKAAQRS